MLVQFNIPCFFHILLALFGIKHEIDEKFESMEKFVPKTAYDMQILSLFSQYMVVFITRTIEGSVKNIIFTKYRLSNRSESEIKEIEKELKEVKQLLHNFLDTEDFIELRNINFGEAKEEIARYFREHDGEDIGYEELIENLRFDPKYVVQACNELAEEGKIG